MSPAASNLFSDQYCGFVVTCFACVCMQGVHAYMYVCSLSIHLWRPELDTRNLQLFSALLAQTSKIQQFYAPGLLWGSPFSAFWGYSWPAVPTQHLLGFWGSNLGSSNSKHFILCSISQPHCWLLKNYLLQLHAVVAPDEKIRWGIGFKTNKKWEQLAGLHLKPAQLQSLQLFLFPQ